MKFLLTILCLCLLVSATLCCMAEDVTKIIPPVFDNPVKTVELANSAIRSYPISEYEGDFTVTIVEDGKTELDIVHFRYKAPKWCLEWSVLDPETKEVKLKYAESYNGKFSILYNETKVSRRMWVDESETIESCPHAHGGPRLGLTLFLFQEIQILVQGGGVSCSEFSYFAGTGTIAGVAESDVYVGLGKTGWTAVFFDQKAGYPKEVWQGGNDTPGMVKTRLTSWIKDDKGRYYARSLSDEMRVPGQATVKTVDIKLTNFARVVAKDEFAYVPPDGTLVTQNGEDQYLTGKPQPLVDK